MRKRKWMISLASAGLSFALFAGSTVIKASAAPNDGDSCDRKKHQVASSKRESPFACDRLALDPAARKRHFDEVSPQLRSLRKAVRELPDGYEFQYPGDPKTIMLAAEWAARERICCPFFDIQFRMGSEDGPFWVRVTGRKGTKDFIKGDGAAWIQPVS